jgi:hypothetical protein
MGDRLVALAQQWVSANYPYNSYHLLRTLEWLDRIVPNAGEAVRIAALTHDMERAFSGPEPPIPISLNDPAYDKAHADRSARIVGRWLRENGADEALAVRVEELIRAHETGGSPEASAVQAADSLSFLDTNVDLFLAFVKNGKYSRSQVRLKFTHSYDRIRLPHARELARPLLAHATARLDALDETV